jgi:hypothetical protein
MNEGRRRYGTLENSREDYDKICQRLFGKNYDDLTSEEDKALHGYLSGKDKV